MRDVEYHLKLRADALIPRVYAPVIEPAEQLSREEIISGYLRAGGKEEKALSAKHPEIITDQVRGLRRLRFFLRDSSPDRVEDLNFADLRLELLPSEDFGRVLDDPRTREIITAQQMRRLNRPSFSLLGTGRLNFALQILQRTNLIYAEIDGERRYSRTFSFIIDSAMYELDNFGAASRDPLVAKSFPAQLIRAMVSYFNCEDADVLTIPKVFGERKERYANYVNANEWLTVLAKSADLSLLDAKTVFSAKEALRYLRAAKAQGELPSLETLKQLAGFGNEYLIAATFAYFGISHFRSLAQSAEETAWLFAARDAVSEPVKQEVITEMRAQRFV